jgi:hypothetical protein
MVCETTRTLVVIDGWTFGEESIHILVVGKIDNIDHSHQNECHFVNEF